MLTYNISATMRITRRRRVRRGLLRRRRRSTHVEHHARALRSAMARRARVLARVRGRRWQCDDTGAFFPSWAAREPSADGRRDRGRVDDDAVADGRDRRRACHACAERGAARRSDGDASGSESGAERRRRCRDAGAERRRRCLRRGRDAGAERFRHGRDAVAERRSRQPIDDRAERNGGSRASDAVAESTAASDDGAERRPERDQLGSQRRGEGRRPSDHRAE